MTDIDAVDARILQLLAVDGRMPNSALAARVGIAPSTCLGRVRTLRERGILRGFAADIDPAALGYPIQAMISIRMQPHARDQLTAFMDRLMELPSVLNAFLLGGTADFRHPRRRGFGGTPARTGHRRAEHRSRGGGE
jgi:DNA-binding Lrp family transcriptional regulator